MKYLFYALIRKVLTERTRDRREEHKTRIKFCFQFYLNVNHTKVRKNFFLIRMTGISRKWWSWRSHIGNVIVDHKSEMLTRQKQLNKNPKTFKEFLMPVPTVESPYHRTSSTKLNSNPVWASKPQFTCTDQQSGVRGKNVTPFSMSYFHKTFEVKDQYDTC